jgi:hypothetical protein
MHIQKLMVINRSCHGNTVTASYLDITTSIMPRPKKSARLAAPLKAFKIPVVSWRPNRQEFKDFQRKWRVTYTVPDKIKVHGKQWYRVAAYDSKDVLMGVVLLPPKYYPLWRRLVYGALFQEKMYEAWSKRTQRLKTGNMNAVEKEMLRLKHNAGVRLVQYLLCRRMVLEELMKLRFGNDNNEPVIQTLVEFGIRESRDWMFESFEYAKKQGASYLGLDPTNPKNKKDFGAFQGS